MTIREKYNAQETITSFTIYPKKPSVALYRWILVVIMAVVLVLFLLNNMFDKGMRFGIYIVLWGFTLHSLYNIYIGSKVQYTFDIKNNAIFRSSPLSSRKKIMKLDQAVIFVNSEMGSWYYAVGAKKSQFVKSYRISETFGSGKESDINQAAYDNYILASIYKLLNR